MNESFKGVIPTIMEMSADNTPPQYEPFTIESFHKLVHDLDKQDQERRSSGWKPEYVLSQHLAEEMPYEWLDWLCKTYRVLCSLETSLILERREKEHNSK